MSEKSGRDAATRLLNGIMDGCRVSCAQPYVWSFLVSARRGLCAPVANVQEEEAGKNNRGDQVSDRAIGLCLL